jgi:hypothetical protein
MPRNGPRWSELNPVPYECVPCPRRVPQSSEDVTVYLVLNDHGKNGSAYDETDPAEADRETIIRNFLSGQYSSALRVIAFNTRRGLVSRRVRGHRGRGAGASLRRGQFIDRHVTPGEKRPRWRRRFGGTPTSTTHCESVVEKPAREWAMRPDDKRVATLPTRRRRVGTDCLAAI